ncbi:MAG: hypothetical protein ACREDR_22115 [Blastocatellia bacterium]
MKSKGRPQNQATARQTAGLWCGPVFGLVTRHNMPGLIEIGIAWAPSGLTGGEFSDYSVTRQ